MKKILIVTPWYSCGGWLCIEKIARKLPKSKYCIDIVGLGQPDSQIKTARYFNIPSLNYNRYGHIAGFNPVFGFLWNLPLFVTSIWLALFNHYAAIIYNGLTLGLILSPIFRLLGKRNIIMYHSEIRSQSKRVKFLLGILAKFVDLVVVNSIGSKDDLSQVISQDKIYINRHYVDDIFINLPVAKKIAHNTLKVLYVGRFDESKRVYPLIDFAEKMGNDPRFSFSFVGQGLGCNRIKNLEKKFNNISYDGYIKSRNKLAKLYSNSDVVWSFADTTYLALPAIESLASDTPIIVPKYAAIMGKDEIINKSLVPRTIGWLVDSSDPEDINKVLLQIHNRHDYLKKKCRQYATKHFHSHNLIETMKKISSEINLST